MLMIAFSVTDHLFCTVGVHPTRSGEFENTPGVSPDEYMDQLLQIAVENRHKIVCIGECGLGKLIESTRDKYKLDNEYIIISNTIATFYKPDYIFIKLLTLIPN